MERLRIEMNDEVEMQDIFSELSCLVLSGIFAKHEILKPPVNSKYAMLVPLMFTDQLK